MHMNNYDKSNMDSNTVQSGLYQCTVNIPCAFWITQNTSTDNGLYLFVLSASWSPSSRSSVTTSEQHSEQCCVAPEFATCHSAAIRLTPYGMTWSA